MERAEHAIGRQMPEDMRALYAASDGGEFVGGNLQIHPLIEGYEGLTLATASNQLRERGEIDDDVIVFGGNGGDESLGIWLPKRAGAEAPILLIGELAGPNGLAVVGGDMTSFLVGWSAFYLALAAHRDDTSAGLEALGVPPELWRLEDGGSDEEFAAIIGWANPNLPDPDPDPYQRGITPEGVRELYG